MSEMVFQSGLSHRAVCVYIYLCDRAGIKKTCYPSISRIAGDIKVSRSTVIRAIRELREYKLIETQQRWRANGGRSSLEYHILL